MGQSHKCWYRLHSSKPQAVYPSLCRKESVAISVLAGLTYEQHLFDCRNKVAKAAAEDACDLLSEAIPPSPGFRLAELKVGLYVDHMHQYDNSSAELSDSWVDSIKLAVESSNDIVSGSVLVSGMHSMIPVSATR